MNLKKCFIQIQILNLAYMKYERIFTETPKIAIWDRIDILTTLNGVKKQLEIKSSNQNINLSEKLIIEKAKGVAFCIRSSRDLFSQSNSKNLTPSLTSLYYGTYNLLSALMIGNVANDLTLESIENFSKNGGHGLKSIYNSPTFDLANDEFIYCCNNGFYKELLKSFGYNFENIVMPQNYKKFKDIPEIEIHKLISLKDLLSRIPELKNIYVEIFQEQPNYLNYFAINQYNENKGKYSISIDENQNTDFLKSEQINNILNLPKEFIFEYKKTNSSPNEQFICENIPSELINFNPKYSSPIANDCQIKQLLGIDDMLLLYFKLFYILSIWTRYRPNLWREVCDGQYDQYRSLFTILTDAAERVIPNLFLDKFYERRIILASQSYWG